MPFHFQFADNATLTIGVALTAGMLGQAASQHLRLPGIVLLLFLGAVLGPDVANVVQPESLGDGLMGLVGFAVAVILFEGGMSLDLRRLRREQRPIRQLISVGALASLTTGAVLAALVLRWEWRRSLLFGTLVVVTGPTVVNPLLRRLRVKKSVSTVLEAEGVFVDALGAITAAVALELVLQPSTNNWAMAAPDIAGRLLFGGAVGVVGGATLSLLLRFRNVVPEGLENPFTLAWAVLVFEVANAAVHESGIAAVTVAGLIVGNTQTHVGKELAEFKEQLTILLIGMLFVLLVADVRLADVTALGWPGLMVALGCIVLVRPLSVWLGTLGTALSVKERVFIGWIGPRGIVAAAVASLFGYQLEAAGIPGGRALRALVFLVIAVTVLWSAASGGVAASMLGLRRKAGAGWVIVGANSLAIEIARLLSRHGGEVVCIDQDPQRVNAVERAGLRALHANALEHRTAERAQLETRTGALSVTANEEVNYLFSEKARIDARGLRFAIGLTSVSQSVTAKMVHEMGGELLFGASIDVSHWSQKIERGNAKLIWWRLRRGRKQPSILTATQANPPYVPLVHERKNLLEPVTDAVAFGRGSQVAVLVDVDSEERVKEIFRERGWAPIDPPPALSPGPEDVTSTDSSEMPHLR